MARQAARILFDRQLGEIDSLAPAEAQERGVLLAAFSPGPAAGASGGRAATRETASAGSVDAPTPAIPSARRSRPDLREQLADLRGGGTPGSRSSYGGAEVPRPAPQRVR
jgi:hypothetical protein